MAQILFLHAEMTSRPEYKSRMASMWHMLTARHLEEHILRIDGSAPDQKVMRDA